MGTIDLRELRGDKIVIHYGGALTSVDAYTFANSLIAFADTARAVNALINPSQGIEVRLEAVGPGSYRAVVRWVAKEIKGIFQSAPRELFWLIIGLLLARAWDGTPTIHVTGDEVVIEQGGDRIVVPREAYKKAQEVKDAPEVKRNLKRTFQVIERDPSIQNFGVTANLDDPQPLVQIDRVDFPRFTQAVEDLDRPDKRRSRSLDARVVILKAWLDGDAKHKWSFEWNGVPVSAPIRDAAFLERLSGRDFLIGAGDALDVTLSFQQDYVEPQSVFVTDVSTYVVERVNAIIPKPASFQRSMFDED